MISPAGIASAIKIMLATFNNSMNSIVGFRVVARVDRKLNENESQIRIISDGNNLE